MLKLKYTKRADLLLAISEYSRMEAIDLLGFSSERVINISSAANYELWQPTDDVQICEKTLLQFGIRPNFFLYAPGGFDYRKNLDGLFSAYALLSDEERVAHQLVITSRLDPGRREILELSIKKCGLKLEEVILTDYVSDEVLRCLYSRCFAYIFPSLHEGFGLPILEALSCGAIVVASNRTSIPEVLSIEEALFDPYDPQSIASRLSQLHGDSAYRDRLKMLTKMQISKFSWLQSGKTAVEAILSYHNRIMSEGWKVKQPKSGLASSTELLDFMKSIAPNALPTHNDIISFYECYNHNINMVRV